MPKSQLILWAMLVSSAISQASKAADKNDYILQRQEPVLDTSAGVSQASPAVQPSRAFQSLQTQASQAPRASLVPQSMPASSASQFSPVSQISKYSPAPLSAQASRSVSPPVPAQIAMVPAYAQDSLFKALYGWSSVLTVEFVAPLSTGTAKVGDVIETKLVQDFRWGPQLIAAKDSLVRGHVTEVESARTLSRSAVSSDRRLKSRGRLSVQFDEIVDQDGRVWPIKATPCPRQKNNVNVGHSTQRYVEADTEGRIVKAEAGLAGGLKTTSDAAKVVTMVPLPGTILFTTLAPAVAMGAVGAASPSIAYDKPIDENSEHRRAKGAAYGFFSNLPGAFVVKSVVEKGNEIALTAGDQLTLNVCIKDTGYRLPPGQQLNVNGKIMGKVPLKRLYPADQQNKRPPTY